MVALINTSRKAFRTITYNEQKIKTGKAELLMADGFIKPADKLSLDDKIRQFQRYNSLNERIRVNTLHISLNFSPSDTLYRESLKMICRNYMDMIGFRLQPYLVYQHFDAGHPHVHIVTTCVKKDGRGILLHNLGPLRSIKACRAIESQFGLYSPGHKAYQPDLKNPTFGIQKVIYGQKATKKAISDVLMAVIRHYRFDSLLQYNAILNLFNVFADGGREGSRMFTWKGLIYRVLDENGKNIGSPIKASDFHYKPTLAFLEQKFIENSPLKLPFLRRLQVEIEYALIKSHRHSVSGFVRELEKNQISTVFHKDQKNSTDGILFVDHKTKSAFEGADLGTANSLSGILERLGLVDSQKLTILQNEQSNFQTLENSLEHSISSGWPLISKLLQSERSENRTPYLFYKYSQRKNRIKVSL